MADKKLTPITFENVRILFKNFSGAEGRYNAKGDRNFALVLSDEDAAAMERDGWNVKYLAARNEDETPTPYIAVKVNYNGGRPPRAVLINSRGRTNLGEDEVSILDYADIKNIDLVINPSRWEVNGKTGIKAYLKSIFVTINEDELDLKYADVPEAPDSAASAREYTYDEPSY